MPHQQVSPGVTMKELQAWQGIIQATLTDQIKSPGTGYSSEKFYFACHRNSIEPKANKESTFNHVQKNYSLGSVVDFSTYFPRLW